VLRKSRQVRNDKEARLGYEGESDTRGPKEK